MNKKFSASDFVGMPLKQVSAIVGIPYKTLWKRVNVDKKSFNEAINTPLRKPFIGCRVSGCNEKHEAKGYCNMHYQQWLKNGLVRNRQKNKKGTGWVDADGYKYLNDRPEHILIAEQAIGRRIPKGCVVHHVDGNRLNNSNTNLVVCPSQAYHMLLHQRQRAMDESGNPNFRKCKFCKKYDSPSLLNSSNYHRECRNEYLKLRRNTQ